MSTSPLRREEIEKARELLMRLHDLRARIERAEQCGIPCQEEERARRNLIDFFQRLLDTYGENDQRGESSPSDTTTP